MAGRKKSTRKKATTKKTAPARKGGRKKATRAGGAPARAKKAPARKPAAAARKPASAAAAKQPAPPLTAEQVARRIVRMTVHPETLDLQALYAPSCTSREASGDVAEGIEAIEQKFAAFESMVRDQRWKARNTWVRGSRICIEWQGEIETTDGRSIQLDEVAVHELKGGKIVAERFYYDPALLEPPGTGRRPGASPGAAPGPPPVMPDLDGPSPIDPLDL